MTVKPYVIFEDGVYKKVDADLVSQSEMEVFVSGSIAAVSGFVSSDEKGAPNGVATLDGSGKVPTSQLAISTDDVSEGTNLYFTAGRAQAAVVVSGIVDGDEAHSPSSNAVFDALALKASISYVDGQIDLVEASVATVSGLALSAQSSADSAQSAADSAQSTADSALSAANSAQSDVDALEVVVSGKADTSHTHAISDITGLQSALNNKSDVGHTHVAADITDFTAAARTAAVAETITDGVSGIAPSQNAVFDALALKLNASEKGANNGVATLDSNGKVPVAQLPNSIMDYVGVWDAGTNTPTLADGAGNADEAIGDVYRVSASGTVDFGSGGIEFSRGDYLILNDSKVWERSPGADIAETVTSVNGQIGAVVLDTDDVNEGSTNLYYTSARFDTAFAAKSTSNLTEGTNLYYTASRFNTAFAAKSTNDLAEGVSGLYFTDERAQDAAALMFVDTSTIDFTYSDGANQMVADVKAASITASHIAGSAVGNGLTGGAGTALAVLPNEAIKVSGSGTSVDFARSIQNDNGGTVSGGQVVYVKSNGHVDLAQATISGLPDVMIGIVEDTTIATNATGKIVVRPGKIVAGFSSLTPGLRYYVSRSSAGSVVKWADASFVSGDTVYEVGKAISTTEILFNPSENPILYS